VRSQPHVPPGLDRRAARAPRERPLVVSVNSAGDWATRLLYPSLPYLKILFGNFRNYDDQ